MSEDHDHGATTIRATKGGGGAGKWLLGGLAAVVIAGGAYAAWKMTGQQQPVETAYNDTYDDSSDPVRAGPLGPSDDLRAESATPDESTADPASSDTHEAAPAPRSTTRSSTARAEAVPEETIGITPVNATSTQDADEIIVPSPRRPIWARTPSERRLSALYPARALQSGREGEASLHCTVLDGGALDCAKVSETPGGFGNAALRIARTYRHAPTTRDGRDAVGTPLNLHVVFRIEDEGRGSRRYASNY